MINIKDQIPSIYYDASRDFQILGHLYEVVLNYVKTNADMLYLLPNGMEVDTRTTELLATTLGFKIKRNYDNAQLAALVSIFPRLLKIKGTKNAIDLAGNALVKASGAPGVFTSKIENHILVVHIPIEVSDITLFIDLLPYILPAGLRVSIIRSTTLIQKLELPIGATAVMQNVFPKIESNEEHPLGLARISQNANNSNDLSVDYSNSDFIGTETGSTKAIAGLFGATPIIKFDLTAESASTESTKEEN